MTTRWGIRSLCGAVAVLLLPACSGLLGTEDVIESAHVVFLTRADCSHVVTNRTRTSFAVLGTPDDFGAQQGDLIVGNLRTGSLRLGLVPFGAQEVERTLVFDVVDYDLSLAKAQELYYDFCPLPAREIPPGTPGLPLAPGAVPVDTTVVPADTSNVF
jgi:hypothetical protein